MSVAYMLAFAAAAAADAASHQNDKLAVEVMHNYGACVAKLDKSRARQLLAMDYRSDEYTTALIKLADRNKRCVPPGGQLRFQPILFAGAVAEELLKSGGRDQDLVQRLSVDPVKIAAPVRSDLDDMALCTITRKPAESAQLLATRPVSKEESAVIRSLAPTLTDCLRHDLKATFNVPALRSIIALNAWRLANAISKAEQ